MCIRDRDYWSEAYQRIDASVKEILRDELTEDRGIYCIMYREYNDIVCTLYSDEGLNGVMSVSYTHLGFQLGRQLPERNRYGH